MSNALFEKLYNAENNAMNFETGAIFDIILEREN